MALHVIYGKHKQALLDTCLKEISAHTQTWPDRRAFLVVPEQVKADTERRYLEHFGHNGLMMAEVLSFRRLAYRLFAEAGGLAGRYISPTGKTMLLQSLIRTHRDELKRFARFAEKPGYAAEVDAVLGDFSRYAILPQDLLAAGAQVTDPMLADKLNDFAILADYLKQAMAQRDLLDREQDLDRLILLLDHAQEERPLDFLSDTSIWIYGFGETRDFTVQEYGVIERLLNLVPNLSITLCADQIPLDPGLTDDGPDVFRHGRVTASHLTGRFHVTLHKAEDCRPEPFATLAAAIEYQQPADLHAFRDRIHLIRAADTEEELSFVAGEIRRLTQLDGYRYRDIAIAVCDLQKDEYQLKSVFREFGLDTFIDSRRPLAGTPLMRYLDSLLRLCQRDCDLENLTGLLRTGLTEAKIQDIDRFENFCLENGLNRPTWIFDDRRYFAGRRDADLALAFRRSHLDPVRATCDRFRKARSGPDKCRTLMRWLSVDSGLAVLLEQKAWQLKNAGEEDAAIALVKSWNTLIALMEELMLILDNGRLSAATFRNILLAGLSGLSGSAIPAGIDRVTVGDLRQISQQSCKILFIVGATQSSFPPKAANEGLLRNHEREQVSFLTGKTLPNLGRHKVAEDAFRTYTLLTLPQDRLYLSCPDLQDNPSALQSRLQAMAGDPLLLKKETCLDVRSNSLRRAYRKLLLLQSCPSAVAPSAPASDASATPAFSSFSFGPDKFSPADPDRSAVILSEALKCLQPEFLPPDGVGLDFTGQADLEQAAVNLVLPTGLVLERFPDNKQMSISQIQLYNQCPYAYYARYLIGLRDREVDLPDVLQTGILMHAMAEQAFSDLHRQLAAADQAAQSTGRMLTPHERQTIYQAWYENLNEPYMLDLYARAVRETDLRNYAEPVLQAHIGRRIRRFLNVSLRVAAGQIDPAGFMPSVQEWRFPSDENKPLTIRVQDRTLIFGGVIDRIDVDTDGQFFRIIDYKSGKQLVDYDAIYHGLTLQLPAYLHVYQQQHPGLKPAAFGYFHFDNPRWSFVDSFTGPDTAACQERLQENLAMSLSDSSPAVLTALGRFALRKVDQTVGKMLRGRFPAQPACLSGSAELCGWCGFQALCHYDNRTIRRRRRQLERVGLPADYPDLAAMKSGEKKQARKLYLEAIMQKEAQTDATMDS